MKLPRISAKTTRRVYFSGAVVWFLNAALASHFHKPEYAQNFVVLAMLFAIIWYVLYSSQDDDNDPKPPTRGSGGRGVCLV
jgi:hypothetical protein